MAAGLAMALVAIVSSPLSAHGVSSKDGGDIKVNNSLLTVVLHD